MSPIGRIFLVLNLILSAAFLGWASNLLSTSEDFQGQLQQCQAEKAEVTGDLEEEISSLNARLAEAESNASNLREERDAAKQSASRAEAALVEEKDTNARLRETVESNTEKLADYNARLESLMESKDRAVEDAREMQAARDDAEEAARLAEAAKRDAQDAAAAAEAQIAELETQLTAARAEVQRLDATLQQIMSTTNLSLNDFKAVPKIDATILDVRDDIGLVALNVGDRDGVERGMTFSVYRGADYKGKVRIENVEQFQSSGIISRPSPSAPISKGDRATTQL